MEKKYRDLIAKDFESCIQRTILRLDSEDTHRPFHKALMSEEALFWSRFERSFSTSFGQGVIERISREVALSGGATAAGKKEISASLKLSQLAAIDAHISALRSKKLGRTPNWELDFAYVDAAAEEDDRTVMTRIISDLWWEKDGVNNYMSIKTVKPNIDQTAEAKRDLLKLKLHDPNCNVYFGLYYNPYGENKTDYAWTPPKGIFDFSTDGVVLIGRDYWDTLGGVGIYDEILAIAGEVGERTRASLQGLFKPHQ